MRNVELIEVLRVLPQEANVRVRVFSKGGVIAHDSLRTTGARVDGDYVTIVTVADKATEPAA